MDAVKELEDIISELDNDVLQSRLKAVLEEVKQLERDIEGYQSDLGY